VYLPVNVDGAMLALGDVHARQGHGELCGVAVEIAAHVTLVVDLIKEVSILGPRLESDTHLMSIGCARPLEDAYRISQHDLVSWVRDLTGLDTLDAYQLVSQAGTAQVGNVCDSNYSMVAAIDRGRLPAAVAFDGLHQRLRGSAAALS
jgi:acetamidase/formamidase